MPTPALSEPNSALVPEPYNQSDERCCRHLLRIRAACGRWPWELVQGLAPEKWGESAADKLALAVERVYSHSSSIPSFEFTEWLMKKVKQSKKGHITHKICLDAWDWVKATDQERRGTSTISTRSRKMPRNSSSEVSSIDPNGDMTQAELPHITRPQPASRQKRTLRPSISATTEEPPTKQNRKANSKVQRRNNPEKIVQISGHETDPDPVLDLDSDADAETEPERDPEPDIGMDMVLDVENVNLTENLDTDDMGTYVGETSNAKDDKAMLESILRLQAAHCRLQDYENELSNERQAFTSLNTMIANAEKALADACKQRDNAIQESVTGQTDLAKIQSFAMGLGENMRASMNKPIEDAGRILDEAIKKRDHAEKNLQMQQKELNQHTNARQTAQNYMNMIPRFINLCKDEINSEKENQKVLFLRRDLRSLSPDGLSRIFDAGFSECLELMLKIREEKV